MKRRGFTLLQIVVVVTIVLILAALLFPLLARSRGSRPASCNSNLKQIALGFKQYIQDYDEKFPLAKNSNSGLEKDDNWAGALSPYLRSKYVFQCPSDDVASDPEKSSYAYNSLISQLAEKKIDNTAYVVLNFEVTANPDNWTQTGTGPQAVSASTRHLEGSNFSFVDGQVKWLRPQRKPTFHPG